MTHEDLNESKDIYQILVRGKLDPHWGTWFENFTISYVKGDTILTGSVVDQAALHRILSKIRDLGLFIIFVQLIS